ncbi:50S ribosomal protein L9e [Fonticula alba]|uniref:50S ribosomal protein L9e n=1 Tax=Fonticula alba TaxID=691883 RepID=A0A058Z8M8_FONAL|nr:50S ribosomal protein L9e [Fonticula alba]KCV69882.1 50S ribosomal protein L9e [Fonticula alba]|eukprot:XP_009495488.1 50S ribosomal protein L9e [Fonticula alba]
MRPVQTLQKIVYPEDVSCKFNGRTVTVTGPRGTLTRTFDYVSIELKHNKASRTISVCVWFGHRKHVACVNTIVTHIKNMITGVTKGFEYKMRYVYNHFPINVIVEGGKSVEIRNFLGERRVRVIEMLGETVAAPSSMKDELILTGNDIDHVSQSAASIQQACLVKNKDIRKFLDGIYVSERGTVVKDD